MMVEPPCRAGVKRKIDDDGRIPFPFKEFVLREKIFLEIIFYQILIDGCKMFYVITALAQKRKHHRRGRASVEVVVEIQVVSHK